VGLLALGNRKARRLGTLGELEVVGRTSLGTRHAMYLVRVGERVLLVGAGNQGPPALLAEIEPNELRGAGAVERATPRGHVVRRGVAVVVLAMAMAAGGAARGQDPVERGSDSGSISRKDRSVPGIRLTAAIDDEAGAESPSPQPTPGGRGGDADGELAALPVSGEAITKTAWSVGLFALISLVPIGVLMLTAFVRLSVVLLLVRQALGSPQVPGNAVVTVLALLLTALVMAPVGERVYREAIEPVAAGRAGPEEAWRAGSAPIKAFMIEQIVRSKHQDYLWRLYDHAVPQSPGRLEPTECEQFPLRVVAPAFLLSELTTAFFMGFGIYLPFLVIDLVVATVLSAMGLFMMPPVLVGLPIKLVLFVLADGWMLVADVLLRSFGSVG
jgi:flagellar biosynthetic protein FliP